VLIGNGGAEMGMRGYVTAYDADSGRQIWRFYTVPGDPSKPYESAALRKAVRTWSGEWWQLGAGGPVWDSMAYDPDLNLIYIVWATVRRGTVPGCAATRCTCRRSWH